MIKKILTFNEPGFYQGKAEQIKNAVNEYDTARSNSSLSNDEKNLVKSNSERILESIIVESGFRQAENAFISMEKEFYCENQLDLEKLEKFQKEMLLQFADQQTKWTFAGTTSLYSSVTKHNIEQQGHEYTALLPGELKDSYENEQITKHINDSRADFQLFLYSDGSVETDYQKNKARFAFDKLKNRSGFDFKLGYSPNNVVQKKEWTSGFNENNEWEKLDFNEDSFYYDTDEYNGNYIFANAFYDSSDIGLIAFSDSDYAYIFDENLNLKESKQENFYSITGELYGVREVDINKSVSSVKNYLKRNNIKKIAGFVLGNVESNVQEYYQKQFKDFIKKDTRYYTKNSKELKNILSKEYKKAKESELSDGFLAGFYRLTGNGRRGDELFSGLVPSIVQDEYTVKPDIFRSKDDLNTFISMKNINNLIDDETREIINNLSVPKSKMESLSNATQNLLHNYKHLFTHSDMTPGKVIKTAYDVIVKNKPDTIKKIKEKKITTEMNLLDFIQKSSVISNKADIPGFKKVYKKENDFHDIYNPGKFYKWAVGISSGPAKEKKRIKEIKSIIAGSEISKEEKNKYVGIIDERLNQKEVKNVKKSLEEKQAKGSKQVKDLKQGESSKHIKDLDQVEDTKQIKDIKEVNPVNSYNEAEYEEAVSQIEELISKTDLPEEKKEAMITTLSLFARVYDADDRDTGVLSAGNISHETIDHVWERISKIDQPGRKREAFSLAVQNVFAEYNSLRISTGMTPLEVVKAIEDVVIKNSKDELYTKTRLFFENNLYDLVVESSKENLYPVTKIKEDIFLAKRSESYGKELDLLKDRDITTFAYSPLFYNSGIEEDERNEIIDFIKSVSIPVQKSNNFTGSVVNVVKSFKEKIEPKGVRAVDAVKSVVYALTGDTKKITPGFDVKDFVNDGFDKPFAVVQPADIEYDDADMKDGEGKLYDYYTEVKDLDLTSEDDVNIFVKSHFFKETGFSENDEPEIAGILNNIKVPESKTSAGDLTGGILRILKHYKSKIAPLDVKPAEAIGSLQKVLSGKKEKVPKKLQKLFDEILIKRKVPSGIISAEKINIFKKEGYSQFIKSPEFKKSGISKDHLNKLITYYSDASDTTGDELFTNFTQLPVQYATIDPIEYDKYKIELPLTREPGYSLSHTDVYSTGMMISQSQGEGNNVIFTDVGKSYLSQNVKNSITSRVKGARILRKNEIKPGKLRRIPSVNTAIHSVILPDQADKQFVYTAPSSSFQRKGSVVQQQYSKSMDMQMNIPDGEISQETGISGEYMSNEIPGQIQQNYIADSRALRKSGSDNTLKSGQDSVKFGNHENKMRKTLDDLFKDFVNRMDNIF